MSKDPISCPSGQYFNAEPSVLNCAAIPETLDPDNPICTGLCDPCYVEDPCTSPGSVFPHPTDCGTYYFCLSSGALLEQKCTSPDLYFNFRTHVCSSDPSTCYTFCDICEAYCVAVERVADPYNCHNFYECNPPYKVLFECPIGYAFNTTAQACTEQETCTNRCPL